MATKSKATKPVTEETVEPKTELTVEDVLKLVEAQNKEIAELKKGIIAPAKTPSKREASIEKNEGWRLFYLIDLDEEGNYSRIGKYWGKGGKKPSALGAMKSAAKKMGRHFEQYETFEDGTFALKEGTENIKFFVTERYTDFAIPIEAHLEYVDAPSNVDKFTGYTKILKTEITNMGEPISLDPSKDITPVPQKKAKEE